MAYKLCSEEKKLRDGVRQDPIIFLVDQLLYRAIEMRSSDIHIEPTVSATRIRYRIDGVLFDQESISSGEGALVVSRIKILSSLDIAQRRLPQDGKLMIMVDGAYARAIDLRIATFPTIFGEKLVIRILDRHVQCLSLESLGCSKPVLAAIQRLIERPHGFFLVTGPTGSGKTTTLYALLEKLNSPERHIMTMEDPVEYHIEGITQSQINEKIGFTFAKGLRSLVRQDPDVAMVGEIRDRTTAQIAIEAALTGHLVLSTLHTNDSVGAVTRLLDMGIEPYLLNASLTGVLAQRLVRLAGGKGRIGIFELLVVDDHIRRLIMKGVGEGVIRDYAVKTGMTFLLDDAIDKVNRGVILKKEALKGCLSPRLTT